MKKLNIAVVGATGMVGQNVLKVLSQRNFPIKKLYCFASEKNAGKTLDYKGQTITIEALKEDVFNHPIDIVFFAAGGAISEKYAPLAASKGMIAIDNSSVFRMEKEVPLVVPEVNSQAIFNHKGIIANPNCSTIQAMVALKPLKEKYGIKRIVYSTYQAVSGSGLKGIQDLEAGLKGCPLKNCYPHDISKNCIPQIDIFEENGYTKEEMKMINETQKILEDSSIKVTATAVRVPVLNGHSESVNVELNTPFEIEDIFHLFHETDGLIVQDKPIDHHYPLTEYINGKDEVYIGRIRRDFSLDNGLNFWIVADNIRKGAATNAVQIAEILLTSWD